MSGVKRLGRWALNFAGMSLSVGVIAFLAGCGCGSKKERVAEMGSTRPERREVEQRGREFDWTVKVFGGQVFLSSNLAPERMIGPFTKKSDSEYVCETQRHGEHTLTRHETGGWVYYWSHIAMRGQRVDASALER
jgi:hypothetical protein